jgi:8-oxo-dGTP pyrophosphatase MutT (NUDIX family)
MPLQENNMTPTIFYDRYGNVVTPTQQSIIKPRQGVFVLARAAQAVLLVWQEFTRGIPELPGGGIDPGETADQATSREWAEETGIGFDLEGPLKEFRHTRGFFAEDKNEFWIYDQTFRLYHFTGAVVTGSKWRNPEGDLVGWEKITVLPKLPINRAHWCGIIELMPELG